MFRAMWAFWTKNTDPRRKDQERNADLSPSKWLCCCSKRHPYSQTVNSQTHTPLVIWLAFWAHILTVQMSLLLACLASFSSTDEGSPLKELAACSSVGRLVPIGHRMCSWLQIVWRMRNNRFIARDLNISCPAYLSCLWGTWNAFLFSLVSWRDTRRSITFKVPVHSIGRVGSPTCGSWGFSQALGPFCSFLPQYLGKALGGASNTVQAGLLPFLGTWAPGDGVSPGFSGPKCFPQYNFQFS